MKVSCKKCHHEFVIPTRSAGKVEFSQCRSVFRVTYKFHAPCPECRSVLQLSPAGPDAAMGTPIPFESGEITERHSVETETPMEATIPRAKIKLDPLQPNPTVRVTRTVKNALKSNPDQAFRVIEGTLRRPRPVHVALRQSPKIHLPYLKILIAGIIFLGTATTVALTLLAFRQNNLDASPTKHSSPVQMEKAQVLPPTDLYPIQQGPMGGPFEPIQTELASVEEPTFYLPLLDHLTSKFGVREDPIHGHHAFHGGIDIAVHSRAEVPAALGGQVTFSGWKSGYGNTVILKHEEGYETVYGHMTKSLVLKGARVRQGDPIGLVGSTGRSTGNHIHFEVRKAGERIDPLRLKLTKSLKS